MILFWPQIVPIVLYHATLGLWLYFVLLQLRFHQELVNQRYDYNPSLIILNLGYSHTVDLPIPEQITIEVKQNTTINLKSHDKEQLGLFAAKIRSWRPPEPYKGKGISYEGEVINRKAGKSGKT